MFHKINHIHQILISDKKIPDLSKGENVISFNVREIKKIYPSAKYKIWSNNEIESFLENNFDASVLHTYRTLVPYAFKADLARYCLLYIYGGIYIDLGIRLMNEWNIPLSKKFASFKELSFTSESWTTMQNGLIWSLPRRKELQKCISYIVQNCEEKFYGSTPLYITGPILFGRAIAAAMVEQGQRVEADDQFIGEYRWSTPEHGIKNDAYISPDHKLVAFRTKNAPGDLSHLGLKGTNNYNNIWSERKVYGEDDILLSFERNGNYYNDRLKTHLERNEKGLFIPSNEQGIIAYGPYTTLPKGNYEFSINYSCISSGKLSITITSRGGKEKKSSFTFHATPDTIKNNNFFYLEKKSHLFEVVIHASDGFSGYIHNYNIKPIDNNKKNRIFINSWGATSPNIGNLLGYKNSDSLVVDSPASGRLTYGPYIPLNKGKYILNINFSSGTQFKYICLEIASRKGQKVIYRTRKRQFLSLSRKKSVPFPFVIPQNEQDIEFRLYIRSNFSGGIVSFDLFRIQK